MSCVAFGVNINNDIDNRLLNSVEYVADYNKTKATVLAGYINSREFFDYCKQDEKFDANKSLAENNQQTIRKLLRNYFRENHKSIEESAAKRQAEELQGFSSVNAKSEALDYTATMIANTHFKVVAESKQAKKKIDRKQLITKVLNDIEQGFLNTVAVPIFKKAEKRDETFANAYNEVVKLSKEIKALKAKGDKNVLKEAASKLAEYKRNRYNAAVALVTREGNSVQKNYMNMVERAKGNPNEWFSKVFESSKLVSIVGEYKNVLESDKLIQENYEDENDYINPNAENVDEMSKAWEDKAWASFDKSVAVDLKLYFNTLFKLASPTALGSIDYNYDTNNEVGVPTTMGANFIIQQLINFGNTNSVNDFLNSIINVSQQIPECYGLIAIANRAIEDPVFLNKLFTQIANNKIIKTITEITEQGVNMIQSNKAADRLSYMVYTMMNTTRSTMTDVYTDLDIERIKALEARLKNKKDDYFTRELKKEKDIESFNKFKSEIEDIIYDILKKYNSKLNIIAVKAYLYGDPQHITTRINSMLANISQLLSNVGTVVEEYNKLDSEAREAYGKWARKKAEYAEAGMGIYNEPMPIRDMSKINYSKLNAPIVNIAKKLVNYTAVKNELNSINAEGNLSSDVIPNSWITNTMKQIAYSNEQDSNAGLERLLAEVSKGEQYRYTPLYWGVKDSKGNYLVEGLFMRDAGGKTKVNPNARKILQISLFNGIKDNDSANAVMYNRMSKGDYFLTNLYAYFNPIGVGELMGEGEQNLKKSYAGYFMRTPSDAPKNFVIQAPKLNAEGIMSAVPTSVKAYATKVENKIREKIRLVDERYLDAKNKVTKYNLWKAADIYEVINGNINNITYNNMYSITNEDGTVSIPLQYGRGADSDIYWVKGKKVQGETNNIIYDIEFEAIDSIRGEGIDMGFFADIADVIRNEGIVNGEIETVVNNTTPIFFGIQQNLLNELNTFVDQLNNVFEKKDGKWILKKDTTGLIDRAHINDGNLIKTIKVKENGKEVVKHYLSGNFFSFRKLFETNGYNVEQELFNTLSFYGEGRTNLIQLTETGGSINMEHGIVQERNGKLVLNLRIGDQQTLNDIISNWIQNFNKEVINRTQQYSKLLEERFSRDQVFDCMLNTAYTEMSFDDVFEGDVKFYKNAQDFLKRAKEVQAAGTAYAGFDINDSLSMPIKEIVDRNGTVQPIKIGDITIADFVNAYSLVEGNLNTPNARNGFKAVTIYNTVRPSKYAAKIEKEIFDILKDKIGEAAATKKAVEIAKGYRENTKVNDAQSYITIEEFIRRRYADGTLNDYVDILKQIYEVRTGKRAATDIDLAGINARIQVQKNFYFDKHYDTTTETHYPRQIKNAEFVLIPELLEGTELKQLYDIMHRNDIGQINTAETSKAAKKNVLTFWDNNGQINPNFEADCLANGSAAIEDYYYRFLYKQQEVPEHMKDEENKAGIQIMKKILDNADKADETLTKHIKDYFDNYCANIKEDYNRMLYNMGWKADEDGTLRNINNPNAPLDFTDFYEKARHEAQRLGLDEQFVDYITPDEFGNPAMPNYMNNVSSKLESIAQALFNSNITRQTLPGWHAAQVTQVGHGMKVLDSDGKLRELKYHPEITDENGNVKQEAYAEVLIPRWSNLIPKDYTAEQLADAGIDIQLAYRIPTEGKQSVSIIKVVGFLDDVYGSTIMLPDEWVTQTGADFDVDSVYAICHEIWKDKDGNVHKYSADNVGSDTAKYNYYIKECLKDKIPSGVEDELYPNKYRELFKRYSDALKEKNYKEIDKIGKEAGLMTFDEFKNLDEVEKLPRQVRNNNILDAMIAIMNHTNSREENYSRSNFDDITNAMKEMNTARGANKLARSTYNPLDQIDFMENAMSGASLKAFSVTRDTFNSVNNYAGSRLGDGYEITVEYDLTQYDKDTIVAAYGKDVDVESKPGYAIVKHRRLANSNNNRNVTGQLVTVYSSETTAHILDAIKEGAIYNENEYTFGTFKTLIDTGIDYRTAIAFLMQPAITTINEVNNETNSIYINGGGNAVQTAIKRIASNAGFTIGGKPITDYTSYDKVITLLNTDKVFKRAIRELFGAEIDYNRSLANQVFSLDVTKLKTRLESGKITNFSELSQEDANVYNAAFDIAMALTFEKVYNTTKSLEKVMRCSNPDRFGAKQTVRATRMIQDNIREYGFNEENPVNKVVRIGDKNLLEALYPGFNTTEGVRVKDSSYPYLAAFYKYATKPSVDANSILFPTENQYYTAVTNAVQQKLGTIFTDEQYKEYKQYMMSQVYANVPYLNTPLTITEEGWFDTDDTAIIRDTENNERYWDKEVSRIFGYEETESIGLEVKDVYKYDKDSIAKFSRLTPAQKVLWVQMNMPEDRGIFDYLNVNKFNQWEYKNKGYSQQTIRFTDSSDNINEVYSAFNRSFFNTSPYIRLATMDLIKYAFVVEGFKFKKGGLSKIITNNSILKNIEDMGLNVVPVIRETFGEFADPKNAVTTQFIDRFIRSHSEYAKQLKLGRPENKNGEVNNAFLFNIYSQGEGLVFIPFERRAESLLTAINATQSVEDINKTQEYIKINKYINRNTRTNILYKIKKTSKGVYLIPMNLLERNETGQYSVNRNNNKFPDVAYYNTLINRAEQEGIQYKELVNENDQRKAEVSKYRQTRIIPIFKFTITKEALTNINTFKTKFTHGTSREKDEISKFIADVNAFMTSPVEGRGDYILVRSDSRYIGSEILKGVSVTQAIPTETGDVLVSITRMKQPKEWANSIKNKDILDINEIPIEQRHAYLNAFHAGAQYSTYYKVEPVIETEIRDEIEKQDEAHEENIAPEMAAITSDITDAYVNNMDKFDVIDQTAKVMITALARAERHGDKNAAKARRTLEMKNINENRSKDIIDNRKNIYSIVAQYTEMTANLMDGIINRYNVGDDTYNIGQDELYEALREHKEEVEPLIRFLLETITFGDQFGQIMSLPLDSLDPETSAAIKRIRNSINKIRNNSLVKRAFDKMFNNYIANEYSTNPNVRMGLVNLNETFGDNGWWDSNIGDINQLNNKEIQTVVKLVNRIMTQASINDAPKQMKDFLKRLDTILDGEGTFNWDNIIDEQGRLKRAYTAQFLEEKQRLSDAVQEARDTYGEDSIEYINAKLARDEWRARNVHQIVTPQYYIDKNALVRKVLANAPREYVEYMKLIHELYNDNRPTGILTKEERDRRKEINRKIAQLTSEYKDSQTLKSEEERFRARQLKNFIEDNRRLSSEYFKWEDAYGFREALNNNLRVIEQFEKANPGMTLDKRLENDDYREAYEWVKDNTYYVLNEEANEKIIWAFETLKDKDNVRSKEVQAILNEANAYDDFGNIDSRKLSDEQLLKIRNNTKHKYDWTYDSNAGEAILIRDVPSTGEVLDDSFYRMIRDPSENAKDVNPKRTKVIGKINELLSKVVSKDGRIHAKDVFELLTEDERTELADLYQVLHEIKGKRKPKELREKFKANVDFRTNDAAFNEEYAWALTNLKGTKDFDVWVDIFVQHDAGGVIVLDDKGNYVPNNNLYGFIVPKDDKYINKEKTEARKILEDNVEFVPTEYYYAAMKEATTAGKFNEWYKLNHIYNPYTHKYEPLKVWTTMIVNPNGELKGTYDYVATNENQEKEVKEEYVNPNYRQYSTNYNVETGQYNNFSNLSPKEKQVRELLEEVMNFFAEGNPTNRNFIEQGFVPRKRKLNIDTKWYAQQLLGGVGLEFRNDSEDKWDEKVDYVHDKDVDNDYLHLLKDKGYQKPEQVRARGINETEEKYKEYLNAVKARNEEIRKKNLEIDNALMDRDYRTVFAEAIQQQVINNAKTKAKNWLYLLQEDLKTNDAYSISSLTGKLRQDRRNSTDTHDAYNMSAQKNALEMVHTFTRRVIFDQFKERTSYNKYADLARNITSAKYMIFNVTGGIANVGTGFVNIMGEAFAEDNFTKKDLREAVGMYLSNSVSMLADMYKDNSNNFAVALTKYFNVVDFDAMMERISGETAGEYARRIRNLLYGLQSGGEHFMQNAALFAVLKQSRVFNDVDGTTRAGMFQQYIWKTEYDTLLSVIAKDQTLIDLLGEFKRQIKADKQEIYKYDSFKHNIVEDFLRAHCSKEMISEYVAARKEAIVKAKEDWNKKSSVMEMLDVKDGEIVIKDEYKNELNSDMLYDLRNTVIALNKKIHGVYDKIGAARIESAWWGGLVMQYHKHLYPGIMKRFRNRGYYNEQTNTVEMGSYIALSRIFSREFRDLDRYKRKDGSNEIIESIRATALASVDAILNIKTNWQLMPEWERNAAKRALGDLYGIASAILMGIALYAMTDDDDEKESEFVATALYISDRLLSEAQLYTPWGLVTEGKTLYSSPIAATNGPEDLLKGLDYALQWMFNEDFDPNYKTGLYAGQNKVAVLVKRNIPLYRVVQRLSTMTKNNSYYRINEKSLNMKFAKSIADYIAPDK